eukprot:CAMPEP_0113940614 /NCGR_PEP_ID=MMETSP1339-20121228/6714_1 /TAXON_ID=94617 /ORGANISM="Fibrocapsa japonica" /LENGTH=97 /DNA_ID=CAMNT_0000944507 /DNA_START=65 /DNA_END=358 /DNA_ORIENTATION=+ /assembly_acc=CAM_ASM_000762
MIDLPTDVYKDGIVPDKDRKTCLAIESSPDGETVNAQALSCKERLPYFCEVECVQDCDCGENKKCQCTDEDQGLMGKRKLRSGYFESMPVCTCVNEE